MWWVEYYTIVAENKFTKRNWPHSSITNAYFQIFDSIYFVQAIYFYRLIIALNLELQQQTNIGDCINHFSDFAT